MQISAVRTIGFDAGHRVLGHENKCGTFHGHRYTAEIYCTAFSGLDDLGRVIDFSVIKSKVGEWIDQNWDHTMLVFELDPDLENIKSCSGFKKPFVCDFNPTAENMASYLLNTVCPAVLAKTEVVAWKIRLWETPNCYVEVEL